MTPNQPSSMVRKLMHPLKLKYDLAKQQLKAALTRRLLGEFTEALLIRSQTGLYAIDPEDYGVGGELRDKGRYGLGEIARLQPHLSRESRVLVVGSHVGTLAIPLARLAHSVVAIEANPKTFALLKTNIALNGIENCRALNIAASSHEEEIEFLLSRANSGGSKRKPKIPAAIYYYDHPQSIKVPAYSLDVHLPEQVFDLIVMDIEGSEYFALQGMQRILRQSSHLVVEFLPHHLRNVSGVTVAAFLETIAPHFEFLTISTRQKVVEQANFLSELQNMFDTDQEDEGILFSKSLP